MDALSIGHYVHEKQRISTRSKHVHIYRVDEESRLECVWRDADLAILLSKQKNKFTCCLQGGPGKWGQLTFLMVTFECIGKIQYILVNVINSNSGTHLGKHKSLIFNTVCQMATPRLGIFALVTFLILLTRTYSHTPIILRFQKVNKINSVLEGKLLYCCYW